MKKTAVKNTHHQEAKLNEEIESIKAKAAAYVQSRQQQPISNNMMRVIQQFSSSAFDYKKQFETEEQFSSYFSKTQS